jgi:hypothetical protein
MTARRRGAAGWLSNAASGVEVLCSELCEPLELLNE